MPEASPNPTETPTPPAGANTPEARTPQGEIRDAAATTTPTPATETKSDGAADPAATKPAPEAGPPDAYSFTAPEGAQLDNQTIEAATPIFRELGLTQANAQKLVDFYTAQQKAGIDAQTKAYADMREAWANEVKADPELGPKLDAVKAEIGRAKDQLDPTVRTKFEEAMNLTGAGDHPAFVKAFYALSKLVNEGSHVRGGGPTKESGTPPGANTRPSAAKSMYPNLA